MANFNLNDYELVETRIAKFYALYEDGRIHTENMTTKEERERGLWVVKARIYKTLEDQRLGCPTSTGYAFEVDGGYGANKSSALENCETSAIGRALANMGLHGNKRASREEMEKVERVAVLTNVMTGEQKVLNGKNEPWAKPVIIWAEEIAKLDDANGARGLYALAKAENAPKAVLDEITAKGKLLADVQPVEDKKG
jgi:hypothetical protein